jgi:hypothetical protein
LSWCIPPPLLWGWTHSSFQPWLEAIFSTRVVAAGSVSDKNTPLAPASIVSRVLVVNLW